MRMLSLCFPLRQRRVVRRSATSYANRYPFPSPDFDRLAKEKGTKKNKKGKNNEKSRAPSPILGAQFRALAITGSGLHRSVVFVWSVKKWRNDSVAIAADKTISRSLLLPQTRSDNETKRAAWIGSRPREKSIVDILKHAIHCVTFTAIVTL